MSMRITTTSLIALLIMSILCACSKRNETTIKVVGGDVQRGRSALAQFQCGVCHVIPGVRGARGHVGPPLNNYGHSVYVAGKFPNTAEVLIKWIQDPPSMAHKTSMPAMGVSEAQARDMAAYLYHLR